MQKLTLTDDVVIGLYNLKYSLRFISNVFHCSHYTIIRILKENNIKLRTLKEARQIRLDDDEYNKRIGESVSKYYKEHKITRSEEEKKQISKKLMGHDVSDETKKKISDSLEGRKLTKEHKKNIGIASAKRTYIRSEAYITKQRNRHPSGGTIEKIANARRGKKHSEETKEKIRNARKKQILPIKDTLPEKYIQNLLKSHNIKFETHKFIPNLLQKNFKNHRFDIVITDKKIIIEIQSCYFHGCEKCFPSNLNEMQIKNIKRDKIIREQIGQSENWKLVEIWEHDIMKYKKYESYKNTNMLLNSFNWKKED